MSFPHDSDATDSSAAQPAHLSDNADAGAADDAVGVGDDISGDAVAADGDAGADDAAGAAVAGDAAGAVQAADAAEWEGSAEEAPKGESGAAEAEGMRATDAGIVTEVAEQTHLQELGEDALAPAADLPIRLPTFEGPLDLLLFLIRRNEIDIYDIPIESVTKQYMQVLHSMKELDLEVAGDFFVMAATLMYIKSRMLLPTNEQASQPQEEEEEADPRWELVQQLLEYKKYKEAALELQTLVERRQDFLERYYQQEQISEIERELEPADKIELWNTFNKVLRRLSERIVKGEIQDEEISISQSMEYILDIVKTRESFRFTEILEGKRLTVAFLVSTFLAVLELTRLKRLFIVQDAVYGEIECTRRDNPEDEGVDISETEREEAMAPRKAARERKAAAAAAVLTAASGGVAAGSGSAADTEGDDGDDDDGFQPGDDDFNWENFGGRPAAKDAEADADEAAGADGANIDADDADADADDTDDAAAEDGTGTEADSDLAEDSDADANGSDGWDDEDSDGEDADESDSEDSEDWSEGTDLDDDSEGEADEEGIVWDDEDGDADADADWESDEENDDDLIDEDTPAFTDEDEGDFADDGETPRI